MKLEEGILVVDVASFDSRGVLRRSKRREDLRDKGAFIEI